jgi:hypothetical protein
MIKATPQKILTQGTESPVDNTEIPSPLHVVFVFACEGLTNHQAISIRAHRLVDLALVPRSRLAYPLVRARPEEIPPEEIP